MTTKISPKQGSPDPDYGGKRPPHTVMRLRQLGAFHQSRLSFMRVLLRTLKRDSWRFDRPIWRIDNDGMGVATYRAIGPERTYTLIVFSHDLPAEKRSDRVIAEAWDATFTLFDGEPTETDINRLSQNVPMQEAGRLSESELILSRANRSVRLFDYVVRCIAAGTQPDRAQIEPVGYLMRTTAVYGAGKFGAADYSDWSDRDEFQSSFQPELLTVWLIRSFTLDLVEHIGRSQAPDTAVTLSADIRRRFGIGNSTGLGMAPFLMTHPALINSWINARETALARVRAITIAEPMSIDLFLNRLARATINAHGWITAHSGQHERILHLRQDLQRLSAHLLNLPIAGQRPWNTLFQWAEKNMSAEGLEQTVSLMLEPHATLVDDLSKTMSVDESVSFHIDGGMTVGSLKNLIIHHYGWALNLDFSDPAAIARVWYVSAEKLEPRLGERFTEPVEPYEQALAPGRDTAATFENLLHWRNDAPVTDFLLRHPEHRHSVRRIQLVASMPYAEIHDNTISASMVPLDLLRCKLSFFGATKFDPRSDRWIRITMFQGAPFPAELVSMDPDDMAYPPLHDLEMDVT